MKRSPVFSACSTRSALLRSALLTFVALAGSGAVRCDAAADGQRADLERAKALWASHVVPNYTYKVREGGDFGAHETTVVIRNGQCVEAYYWRYLRKHHERCTVRTVEELLAEIGRLIDTNPQHLEVSYDPSGYPRHFSVTPSGGLYDQDWYFDVEYLRSLK